jgi:hypothetical protein
MGLATPSERIREPSFLRKWNQEEVGAKEEPGHSKLVVPFSRTRFYGGKESPEVSDFSGCSKNHGARGRLRA